MSTSVRAAGPSGLFRFRALFVALVLVPLAAGCSDDDGTSPVDAEINGTWRADGFESGGVSYELEIDVTVQNDQSFRGSGSITASDEDGDATFDLNIPRGSFEDPSDTWIILEFIDSSFVDLVIRGSYDGGDEWDALLQNGGFENQPITLRRVG